MASVVYSALAAYLNTHVCSGPQADPKKTTTELFVQHNERRKQVKLSFYIVLLVFKLMPNSEEDGLLVQAERPPRKQF